MVRRQREQQDSGTFEVSRSGRPLRIWVLLRDERARTSLCDLLVSLAPRANVLGLERPAEADAQLPDGAPGGLVVGSNKLGWLAEHKPQLEETHAVVLVEPTAPVASAYAYALCAPLLVEPVDPATWPLFLARAATGARLARSIDAAVDAFAETWELSPRQTTILRLHVRGGRRHDIAEALGMSPLTVKHHVRQILDRAHVEDITEAVTMIFASVYDPIEALPLKPVVRVAPGPTRCATSRRR